MPWLLFDDDEDGDDDDDEEEDSSILSFCRDEDEFSFEWITLLLFICTFIEQEVDDMSEWVEETGDDDEDEAVVVVACDAFES